jgi:hypothetical protein
MGHSTSLSFKVYTVLLIFVINLVVLTVSCFHFNTVGFNNHTKKHTHILWVKMQISYNKSNGIYSNNCDLTV